MPIKLSIDITSPMSPEDHDLLSGVAIMTLAIANREMAKAAFPNTFPDDDDPSMSAARPEEPEHQHKWIPGVLAIEDCQDCGERRLAETQPRPMDVRSN